jgi:hypothetical protein
VYGTVENFATLEDAGIQAHVPLPDFDQRTSFYGKGQFPCEADLHALR